MYGYVGCVCSGKNFSYSLVYSVPGIKKKKVHIRGLGRILISCASESEISETKEKNEQPGSDRF